MQKVSFFFEGVKRFSFFREAVREIVAAIVEIEGYVVGEINIIFCSDDYILQINREHLNHDYYTDIITFDYSYEKLVSGDLYVGLETVISNSQEYGSSFEEELKRVILHGMLHLLGYDDKDNQAKGEMREKEDYYLVFFKDFKMLK